MNVEQEIRDLQTKIAQINKRIEKLESQKDNSSASGAPAPSGLLIMRST